MHSNIKGNKMFFDSAERLKNEISFIEKERKGDTQKNTNDV